MAKRDDADPRILTIDIETAPGTAYIWQLYGNDFIPLERLISPTRVISWGAQWHGERAVTYRDERVGARKMLTPLHAMMSEADAIVTFNGDKFDIPMLTGAFVELGLPALPPLASIDLYKTIKKLGLMSGKLQFVAPFMKIGQKVKHEGFALWKAVMQGDRAAWRRMQTYNIQDVKLTDELYGLLKPHIKNHPRLYPKVKGRPICRVCDGGNVIFRGRYFTKETQYSRFQCKECGTWDKIKIKARREDDEEGE